MGILDSDYTPEDQVPPLFSMPVGGGDVVDSSLMAAPSSGIALAEPQPMPGIALDTQAAAPIETGVAHMNPTKPLSIRERAQAEFAQMPMGQKIATALGEFGAGVNGKASPLQARMEQDRKEKLLQLAETKEHLTMLTDFTKVAKTLQGDAKKNFVADAAEQLNAVRPGLGDTFSHVSEQPGLLENFDKYTQYLPPLLQQLVKNNPDEALKHFGTPEGLKALEGAEAQYNLTSAMPKVTGVLAHYDQFGQFGVPQDLIDSMKKDPKASTLRKIVQALPEGNPYKLSESQQTAVDKNSDMVFSTLGVKSPKTEQKVMEKKGEKERWSEPYQMGGATVQKNLDTGQVRTAVARPPVTTVTTGKNDNLDAEDLKFMAGQYLAGDKSVLQNLGRGVQGSKNVVALRKAIREEAKAAGMTPEHVAIKLAEFEGLKAGERTAGTREAQLGFAAHELEQFIPLAEAASAKVPRTGFKPINELIQLGENQWSPEQAAFVANNRAVINAFSMVASRGAQTVHNVGEAEKMLSTAHSHEAYKATLSALNTEVKAALKAPGQVKADLRGGGDKPTDKSADDPLGIRK